MGIRDVVVLSIGVLLCSVGCSASNDAGTAQEVPSSCLPPFQGCPGGCVDLTSNAQNCGACGFACSPGSVCEAGTCGQPCASGLALCDGQCVDLASTPARCGFCDRACAPGQFCVGGGCTNTCNGTVCQGPSGPQCATLSTDSNHCGACNFACGPGYTCANSTCVLDCGALTECAGACIDVQSDNANCGACGRACSPGQACSGGMCTCAGGLAACGDACVDTALDPAHCGACGHACGNGYLCEGGECVGPDGCTERPVTGLSLTGVDAYQTLQIPIMDEGRAVGPAERNIDVVAGRQTVFRVHVRPEAGWTPRQVSARIELTDVEAPEPTQKETFFALLTPTVPSSDADLGSTFQVQVPSEAIGRDTRYAVSLVECGGAPPDPPAPATTSARFPIAGFEHLAARETGPIKIHIVPISGTDISEQGLAPFKERLEAVYPITEVQFTIGQNLTAFADSMCSLLASVTSRRSQDSPPNDVYYYGLAPGILGGQSGCSNTSTGSRGSKVSAGWAQGFSPDDGRTGAATMCHELGHAHGRFHAPCNVQDPDPRYPHPGANIGVWGYDRRTDEFYEPTRKDMMSYCPEPRWAAWISDYTYQAILERAVEVNTQPEVPASFVATAPASWRLLVSDSAGVHWIREPLIVQGTPDGVPTSAVIHGEQGPIQQVVVYKQHLEDGVTDDAFMLTVPEPEPSWRGIEVAGLFFFFRAPE